MLYLINVHEAVNSWHHFSDEMNSLHKYELSCDFQLETNE